MRTLDLKEAAAFLKMHPEELRRRAKLGAIPGAKVGRAWVFLQDDLADFLRSLYSRPRQALRVTLRKEIETCHFAVAVQSGGSTFALQPGSEYRSAGLRKRGDIWHIDKQVRRYGTLCESTGTGDLEEAERHLAFRLEQIRQATVYGVRPRRSFREAATKYLLEHRHKASIDCDALHLKHLDPFIGDLTLDGVHEGSLQSFVEARRRAGRRAKGINLSLGVVRRILNLAARKWRDEHGLTWLQQAPLISMLPVTDARQPYPLSWEEQALLFQELPAHLQRMALFKVNTGTRDGEVCGLRWDWEAKVPELDTSVFVIPGQFVKNREDRVVVLNAVAKSVVDQCRGTHPVHVFSYRGHGIKTMHNNGWQSARSRAARKYQEELGEPAPEGFRNVRVHDLKHTFGRRLRAAGVPVETRKVLLGHTTGDITSHYSAPELAELIEASGRVCRDHSGKTPALTLIKTKAASGL